MALRSTKNNKTEEAIQEPEVMEPEVQDTPEPEVTDTQDEDTAARESATQDESAGEGNPPTKSTTEEKLPAVREQRAMTMPATKGQFAVVYDQLVDAIPPVDFGILTRIKPSNGTILTGENEDLGKTIEIELYSISHKYVTSPVGNNKEARKLCKFSPDPDTIPGYWDDEEEEWVNDGVTTTTTKDYIAWLKSEHSYTKASTKHYLELLGMLRDADADNEAIGQMVQISLSPQSVKQWTGFSLHTTLKVNSGQLSADEAKVFKITAKAQSFDSNNFTIFTFNM